MDNLTHSLVGALIGQTGLKRKTGLAMPALIIGANLPDVDAACFFWLNGAEHLGFRRGITHGPIALVLLPLILAGLLYGFDRWQGHTTWARGKRPEGRLPVRFGWLFALAFIACLSHPALDWLNVYGIRLLEPFSSEWFYGDTLFIIDVWLWGLMGFATWWSLRQEKRGATWRKTGRQALALVLVYIGVNAGITESFERGHRFPEQVLASPPPLAFWKREMIHGSEGLWWTSSRSLFTGSTAAQEVGSPCLYVPSASDIDLFNNEVEAFLFWSRAPFAERAPDGSVLLRDARFYDARARDRFTVALPDAECEELRTEPDR